MPKAGKYFSRWLYSRRNNNIGAHPFACYLACYVYLAKSGLQVRV